MRFYTRQHRYYCEIDLHARTMYRCILDHGSGKILLHRNLRCEPDRFLRTIEPYRDDVVVGLEHLRRPHRSRVLHASPVHAFRWTAS